MMVVTLYDFLCLTDNEKQINIIQTYLIVTGEGVWEGYNALIL